MYLPRRKRALTAREIAELQEADAARKRRKALRNAENQAQNYAELEQHAAQAFSVKNLFKFRGFLEYRGKR
jgi:uncharacterized protein YydD (DUF2326 family)